MLYPQFASLGFADCAEDVDAQKARIALYILSAMERYDEVERGTLADIVLNNTFVLNGVRVTPRNIGLLLEHVHGQDVKAFCARTFTIFSLPLEQSRRFLSSQRTDNLRSFHYPPNIYHHLVDFEQYHQAMHEKSLN